MDCEYTLETFAKLSFRQMKQTYVYKNIPLGYGKSTLKKNDLLHLLKENPEFFIPDDPCMICYENITKKDKKLECCGKIFHDHCIQTWFEKSDRCPHCRAIQITKYKQELNDMVDKARDFIDKNIYDAKFIRIILRGIMSDVTINNDDINNIIEELMLYQYNHPQISDNTYEISQRIIAWDNEINF
jgi:phage FluMu protein Com